VPVGQELGVDTVPSPRRPQAIPTAQQPGDGSIVVVVATDAPLLPNQCKRLAQRATLGVARVGGNGDNGSGDLFLAFSTGNHGIEPTADKTPVPVLMTPNTAISRLFEAVADATEEAILNAMCMAETMTGRTGRTVHALPLDRLQEIMGAYGPA
jgi:D-aminopeptidase